MEKAKKIIISLQGYKTYIFAVFYGINAIAFFLHWIDNSTFNMLKSVLEGAIGVSVVAKVNRTLAIMKK